ncbi:MAG: hypothetical protein Q4D21_00290 [Phascolarctobacterium sp.]|nr:hypothetical protein [Phascolarctobacterium sp.]
MDAKENFDEMQETFTNPLQIRCEGCGAPAEYDIIHENYHCQSCGATTDIHAPIRALERYRKKHAENLQAGHHREKLHRYNCPNCGAIVVIDKTEATGKCDFCGTKMVNSEFVTSDSFPELIIPFKLTLEEAKVELRKWLDANKNTQEAKELASHVDDLKGYYLPYQVIKGPVRGKVTRARSSMNYTYGSFVEEVAVNTSKQLNNMLLDNMEPFDWREVQPFQYGYIAGQHTKLQDATDKQIDARIAEEMKNTYEPVVEEALMSQDLLNVVNVQNVLKIPALMPVYIFNVGKINCAVNGQTGRVAVSPHGPTTTQYAWLEPVVITLFVMALCQLVPIFIFDSSSNVLMSLMFGGTTALITGIAYSHTENVKKYIYLQSAKQLAKRVNNQLTFTDGKELPDNPALKPVFFADLGKGEEAVDIAFYTPDRIAMFIGIAGLLVFLPNLIGGCIGLATGIGFMGPKHSYAGAWWCLFIPICFILYLSYIRRDIFNSPVYFRLKPDGSKVRAKDERPNSNSIGIMDLLKYCFVPPFLWLTLFILFMIFGSVGAMFF